MSYRNPVRHTVRYYSNLDAGAPAMSNNDANIKTILKACLVTGIGEKEGAGWTALFEDANRIILRRPLGTGSPPDIKVENGVVNGAASHRIVSQYDPIGLDDNRQLAVANLVAKDGIFGNKWHLVVCDFGFILCYQMGLPYPNKDKNHLLYVGSIKQIEESLPELFTATEYQGSNSSGVIVGNPYGFLHPNFIFRDLKTNEALIVKSTININKTEKHFNNDYLAQPVLIQYSAELPFFVPIATSTTDFMTAQVQIAGRSMLRYVSTSQYKSGDTPIYIPLDYWEL